MGRVHAFTDDNKKPHARFTDPLYQVLVELVHVSYTYLRYRLSTQG